MSERRSKITISVVLCSCNGARYIRDQLESIFSQEVLPYEIIVVDDCSDDGTDQMVEQLISQSPVPIKFYRNQSRLGVIGNFEKGLKLAKGDYIALCDQDDVWMPSKLHKFEERIRSSGDNPDVPNLFFSDHLVWTDGTKKVSPLHCLSGEKESDYVTVQQYLIFANFITGCCCVISRGVLQAALPFPANAVMHDWWLALFAAYFGNIYYIDEPLVLYRRHSQTVTNATTNSFGLLLNTNPLLIAKKVRSAVSTAKSAQLQLDQITVFLERCEKTRDCEGLARYLDKLSTMSMLEIFLELKRLGNFQSHPIEGIVVALGCYNYFRSR